MYDVARPLRRWRATNENASGFASKIATVTEPTGDGVITIATASGGGLVPGKLFFIPILLGSDGDISSFRFFGWTRCTADSSTTLWIPTPIGEFSCTAGTHVGVASSAVLATERFCDTITPVAAKTRDEVIAAGTAIGSDYQILSPVDNTMAHVIMPIGAFEKLEMVSDQTTGSATANLLYRFISCE